MSSPVVISVLAQTASANRNLRVTAGISQRVGRGFRSMAAPAAAAVGAIGLVGKQAIAAASDLSEAQSKNKVIFGRQAADIEAFARRADTALGQSRTQALDAASTFGLIGQKAGLGGRETAAFAKKFTGLASDLASFNNTSPEEAITAISAAMRGESEPIRKYGVLLDDATLRARALRLGLVKTTKDALTPQQKALAASAEIMAQTSKAQGDFARTSEGAANKQRIVAAQVENLKAKLGQQLLPVYQRGLGIVSKVITFFSKHQTIAKALVAVMAALAVSILAVNAAMAINPVTLAVAALAALAVALTLAYQRNEGFRRGVQAVGRFVRNDVVPALQSFGRYLRDTVIPAVVATAKRVATNLKPVLTQAGKTIRNDVIPAARVVAAKFREWWPTIKRVLEVTGRLILKLVEFNSRVAGKVLPVITRFAGFLIGKLVPAGVQTASIFVRVIGKVIDFARRIADGVIAVARFANNVRKKIGEAIGVVTSIPGRVKDAIGDLGSLLYNAGRDVIGGLINGIESKLGDLRDKLGSVTSSIPLHKGPPAKDRKLLFGAGQLIMKGLTAGLADGLPGVEQLLGRLTKLIQRTLNQRIKDDKAAARAIRARLTDLRRESRALLANGRAQDRVNRRLDVAVDRLKAARKASKDYAAGVRDQVLAFGSITSLGEGVGFGSFDQLTTSLAEKVKQAKEYARILKQLAKLKLNPTTLQQLIDAGVEGGLGTAQAILAGGQAGIREINQLTAQLAQTGQGLGDAMAQRFHGAGIRVAQGLVAGLRKRQRDLESAGERIAAALIREVRSELGIKTGGGGNNARTTAAADSRGRTYQINITVGPGGNPVEVGRQVRKALDAYERAGGRAAS